MIQVQPKFDIIANYFQNCDSDILLFTIALHIVIALLTLQQKKQKKKNFKLVINSLAIDSESEKDQQLLLYTDNWKSDKYRQGKQKRQREVIQKNN